MPYSDNLYSLWDDESDIESTGHEPSLLEAQAARAPRGAPRRDQPGQTGLSTRAGSSTNVVVGDDDDNDNILAPTDGYFRSSPIDTSTRELPSSSISPPTSSQVPYVPNVWVHDPSLPQENTAQGKAREAEQERRAVEETLSPLNTAAASRSGPSSTYRVDSPLSQSSRDTYYRPSSSAYTYTPSTTTSYTTPVPRRAAYDGRPSFLPREAPPAYTPSPTSPTTTRSETSDSSRNYQTFLPATHTPSTMGRSEETQPLLANHQPESMGAPSDRSQDVTPTWTERFKQRLPPLNSRSRKVIILSLIFLLITTALLTAGTTGSGGKDEVRVHVMLISFCYCLSDAGSVVVDCIQVDCRHRPFIIYTSASLSHPPHNRLPLDYFSSP